mmetsp:Transcript_32015/g.85745  ORF Transcript_32015/g.85745 Transcript_32015/m.85745 type:complete len:492 (-) Transcript_32015:37-1512(-)
MCRCVFVVELEEQVCEVHHGHEGLMHEDVVGSNEFGHGLCKGGVRHVRRLFLLQSAVLKTDPIHLLVLVVVKVGKDAVVEVVETQGRHTRVEETVACLLVLKNLLDEVDGGSENEGISYFLLWRLEDAGHEFGLITRKKKLFSYDAAHRTLPSNHVRHEIYQRRDLALEDKRLVLRRIIAECDNLVGNAGEDRVSSDARPRLRHRGDHLIWRCHDADLQELRHLHVSHNIVLEIELVRSCKIGAHVLAQILTLDGICHRLGIRRMAHRVFHQEHQRLDVAVTGVIEGLCICSRADDLILQELAKMRHHRLKRASQHLGCLRTEPAQAVHDCGERLVFQGASEVLRQHLLLDNVHHLCHGLLRGQGERGQEVEAHLTQTRISDDAELGDNADEHVLVLRIPVREKRDVLDKSCTCLFTGPHLAVEQILCKIGIEGDVLHDLPQRTDTGLRLVRVRECLIKDPRQIVDVQGFRPVVVLLIFSCILQVRLSLVH